MQVADQSARAVEVHAQMWAGFFRPAPLARQLDVVLKPLSRPELGEIRVDDAALAIGRCEPPFASYDKDILHLLSRRHARIFRKDGFVYLVDLESRNGTTVNRVGVGRVHCKLRDGDEICFGGELSYRVQIAPRTRAEGNLILTLTPRSRDAGLNPIVIARFPHLISKTDATFAHYKGGSEHGRQLSYLSRRHAYLYQKGTQAYIEDLGSSNGTFVDGQRLLKHPVALHDGAVVAFGGKHYVYEVSVATQAAVESADGDAPGSPAQCAPGAPPASVSGAGKSALEPDHGSASQPAVERDLKAEPAYDRTQFMAAPASFLQVFCEADAPKDDVAPGAPAAPAAAKEPPVRRRPRAGALQLLSELAALDVGGEPERAPRRWWWRAAAAAGVVSALALTAYFWGAAERDLKAAVAHGEYARAAALAARLLEQHPDDVELKARATEAALKANVPAWLAKIRARDFDGAQQVVTGMTSLGLHDADLRPLLDELEWLGNLERLVSGRGGPEAPIRIYADEDSVEHLIGRWNDDTGEHQRALVRIASHVPQFGDWYGEALSHLRRLQSESSVYLPVIERLKANIASELERDNPEALQPVLQETAQKYPGLGGLDSVQQDLARYLEIRRQARDRQSGQLFAVLRAARFATPPFARSFRSLVDGGQLPSADLQQQYEAATQAWKDGNAAEALAALQKMAAGAWGEDAARELERRRGVAARFAALQQSRNASGFVDQLLAFRESLDSETDVYFVRATAADLNEQRSGVVARAQDAMNRARESWQEYRSDGAIEAAQRVETSISDQFRTRARLLAEASRYAQQGFLIYSQVDPAGAAHWAAIRDEIAAEAAEQRSRLHDLSNVVEPELLKTKLALLGEPNE